MTKTLLESLRQVKEAEEEGPWGVMFVDRNGALPQFYGSFHRRNDAILEAAQYTIGLFGLEDDDEEAYGADEDEEEPVGLPVTASPHLQDLDRIIQVLRADADILRSFEDLYPRAWRINNFVIVIFNIGKPE